MTEKTGGPLKKDFEIQLKAFKKLVRGPCVDIVSFLSMCHVQALMIQ